MLYAFLLLIVAILLFGSSRILGAVAVVFAFIALAFAFATVVYFSAEWLESLGLNSGQLLPSIVLFFLGIVAVWRLEIYLIYRRK